MTPRNAMAEERKPDMEMRLGETTIKIFAPAPVSETVQQARHQEIVQAVAGCLRKQK